MNRCPHRPTGLIRGLVILCFVSPAYFLASTIADERRAPPPTFDSDAVDGLFFDSVDQAIAGNRPSLGELRRRKFEQAMAAKLAGPGDNQAGPKLGWAKLISATSLEDEVKRTRLRFDQAVAAPGAFKSGGFQDARVDLSVLATLFAVIHEYTGDVRWKDDAAAARDLMARTARGCKAGTNPVYNDARNRKLDLEGLVTGSGLAAAQGDPTDNDWANIADRSPLMEYAERLVEQLEENGVDAETIEDNVDPVRRDAELIGMLGEVIIREGMESADDEDYANFSRAMTEKALAIAEAIERKDYAAAESAVAEMRTKCDDCHSDYR